jgi:hypothetical protein
MGKKAQLVCFCKMLSATIHRVENINDNIILASQNSETSHILSHYFEIVVYDNHFLSRRFGKLQRSSAA